MGKRSSGFAKRANSFYSTPYYPAMPVLFPYLPPLRRFAEPCAGDGRMIRFLEDQGHTCVYACDIAPKPYAPGMEPMGNTVIHQCDVLEHSETLRASKPELIITNPPWDRDPHAEGGGLLHEMIRLFIDICPTWLLFDADWAHTLQAASLGQYCHAIVPVGRVKWIEDSEYGAKDNTCWYFFSHDHFDTTRFYWRKE